MITLFEKFISIEKFKKLKSKENKHKDIDPYGEELWDEDKGIFSYDFEDYDIWFKLKKDFGEFKKNQKINPYNGLVRGIGRQEDNLVINFDDKEWFEPLLKYNPYRRRNNVW